MLRLSLFYACGRLVEVVADGFRWGCQRGVMLLWHDVCDLMGLMVDMLKFQGLSVLVRWLEERWVSQL